MNDIVKLIQKLAIISLFKNDMVVDKFVLKGGNLLSMVYDVNTRASEDLDVSMSNDFTEEELTIISDILNQEFESTFMEKGLKVFDFKFYATPKQVAPAYKEFWGGYTIEFKCIDLNQFIESNLQKTRLNSFSLNDKHQKTFKIDISKYEFVERKEYHLLDDYLIYIYTPVMVVFEKLRAICQQMQEYKEYVATNSKPRAKDFFDIYSIIESNTTSVKELCTPENINMLKEIFSIKKVPLDFLFLIDQYREFHRDSFNTVQDTVHIGNLNSYDYYFDNVLQLVSSLTESIEMLEKTEHIS